MHTTTRGPQKMADEDPRCVLRIERQNSSDPSPKQEIGSRCA